MLALLTLSLARADDLAFTCLPVTVPADAHPYVDADPIASGDAAWDELYAWFDATCVTSCASPATDSVSCEEADCVTTAGATLTWRDESEEEYDPGLVRTRTRTLTVLPPASAGLGWTTATAAYTERQSTDSGDESWSVGWSGTLLSAWPADTSFDARHTWSSNPHFTLTDSEQWTDPTCAWSYASAVADAADRTVTVTGSPDIYVSRGDYDMTCPATRGQTLASLDGVFWGDVDWDTWERAGTDADGDGWGAADCDDGDPAVFPCTAEIACDGVDQDCDGADTCSGGDTGGADTGATGDTGGDTAAPTDTATAADTAVDTAGDTARDTAAPVPPPSSEDTTRRGCGKPAAVFLFPMLLVPWRRRGARA